MKECEWCGIDFRGPFKEMEEHVFCSDACMDEWRHDVYGEAEEETPVEGEAGSAGDDAAEAAETDEKEPAAGGEGK